MRRRDGGQGVDRNDDGRVLERDYSPKEIPSEGGGGGGGGAGGGALADLQANDETQIHATAHAASRVMFPPWRPEPPIPSLCSRLGQHYREAGLRAQGAELGVGADCFGRIAGGEGAFHEIERRIHFVRDQPHESGR